MFNNKTRLFLLLSIVLMTMVGISAISAASVDDTISNDTQISTTSYQEVSSQTIDTDDNSINQVKQTNEKTSLSEGETGTLTDLASDISAAEDTITLEKDYAGDSSELTPVTIDKNLIIDGNSKTITAKNSTFVITTGSEVKISNLVFTGNENGTVFIVNGTLILDNVTVKDLVHSGYTYASVIEMGSTGVAVVNNSEIYNITNSTTATKSAFYFAGGSTLTIDNSKLENIFSSWVPIRSTSAGSVLNIYNTTINNLSSTSYGGAIYLDYGGVLNIIDSTIENCSGNYRGGAIYSNANTTIKSSVIRYNNLTSNTQYNRGGAIWMAAKGSYSPSILYLENSTLTPNEVLSNDGVSIESMYVNITSPINVIVANVSYEEGETVQAVALVMDDNANPISGRTITFDIEGTEVTANVANGYAVATVTGLEVDNTYMVTAKYSNALDEVQQVYAGKIEYGNVLPAMTDYTSLQSVIDSQEAGATIKLNGPITRAEEEVNVVINKDLVLDGKGLTIDASQGKMFEITNGATVTIQNVVLTNGNTENLINITNGNVILNNVIIDNSTVINTYNKYGLISVKSGSSLVINNSKIENIDGVVIDNMAETTIDNTTITNCNSSGNGNQPAIIMEKGNLTILNSDISDNQVYSGLIYSTTPVMRVTAMNGTLTIDNTRFANNVITQGSSVVSVTNKTTINGSIFENNRATRTSGANGSAITISYEDMNVTNTVFVNNTASGEVSTAYVGMNGKLNISNSILLSNDSKPLVTITSTSGKAILNNNYWGINDNPTHSRNNLVVTQIEEEDYWGDPEIVNLDVTLNNWVIINTTLTEDPEDNSIFILESKALLNDTSSTISELSENLPNYLKITYEADAGSFDAQTLTLEENVATNTYYAGLDNATLTITFPNQVVTFDVEAPEIDPKDYKGLSKMIAAIPDGQTIEMIKDCTRGENENNITISNRNIVIDGKGFTIDENNGRLFLIENSNVTLKNLIIKNAGTSYNPSVLQIWTGNLVMENVTIIDSTSNSDGALVYISGDSNATIDNVTFANNTARFISNAGKTLLTNSIVNQTDASTSSMKYWGYNNGNLTINNTVFDSNLGYSNGFYTGSSSTLNIDNSTFINNKVVSSSAIEGGVLYIQGSDGTITNSVFENNTLTGTSNVKGILYIAASMNISNVSFYNNVANSTSTSSYSTSQGGVFYLSGRNKVLNVTNSVFINNTGAKNGTVIYNYYGIFDIHNSILINNTCDNNQVVYNYDTKSYANNNWWGTNDDPSKYIRETSSYPVDSDTWVIMNASYEEDDDTYTITTTFNKVTDVDGTITDLVGTIPDGLEVTYTTTAGELTANTTTVVDGVTTNTLTTTEETTVTITQTDAVVELVLGGEPVDMKITNETYPNFFNEDGTPKAVITPGSEIKLYGLFTNKNFTFNIPLNITTDEEQAILENTSIVFTQGASGSNFTNIQIFDENYAESVITVDGASDVLIGNVTIDQYNDEGVTHAIYLFNDASGVIVENCTISTIGPDANVAYDDDWVGHTVTSSISGFDTSNNVIRNNTIVTMANAGEPEAYGTIYGVEFAGNSMDFDEETVVENNTIENNTIYTQSNVYNYGVSVLAFANNNKIINNNITGIGDFDAHGIQVAGPASNNVVDGNTVNLTANNVTYGIYVSTNMMGAVTGNNITNNVIIVNSSLVYGVELWMVDSNNVSDNTIIGNGNYTLGIGTYTTSNNVISNNEINVTGVEEGSPATVDNILAETTGIKITGESNNNTVTNNIINTDSTKDTANAINVTGENNTITDNYLETPVSIGDYAVTGDNENNTIKDNLPKKNETIITVTATTPVIVGDNVIIDISLSANGTALADKVVTVTIGDEEPFNITTLTDGTYQHVYTPTESGELTINVSFDGDKNNIEAENQTTVVINTLNTTIVIDDIATVKYGANVTISGTIKDGNDELVEGIEATIYVNGVEVANVTTDENGTFTYDYTVETLGINNVTVESLATNKYNANNTNTTFEVQMLDITITGEDITGRTLDNVSIAVSVTDENGDAVSDGSVVFTDANGVVLGGADVVDGSASIITVFNKSYDGIVTVTYDQFGVYAAGEGSVNVAISRIGTNLTMIDVDAVKIGENVIVNVVLTDEDNKLMSDETITLTVNNETLTNTTVNGVAKFTLSFNDADEYEIVATYAGNDAYEGSTADITIPVEALNTIIEANATNVVKYGANVTINGIIKDENGVLLEGIEATIYVNGVAVTDVTTDANGAFSYDYTADTIGLNEVLIESVATNNYNANDFTANFGVETLNVTIIGEDVTGTTLTNITIVVSVNDENGEAVNGGSVVFTDANGVVLGSADVVDGSASITTVFNKVYNGVVTVTYAENGIYSAGEGNVSVAISKIASTVTIDPVEGVIGELTTIVANVVDANGNPVNGGRVVFKYNGKTLKDADGNVVQANVVNGVATVDFVVPDSWKKAGNLSAKYGGTSAVDTSDSQTVTPTVSLRNVTITVAPQANTAEAGDSVIYVVIVSDEKTGTLINGVVVVKMAGVTIGQVEVVNGVGMFNYTIPTSRRAEDYNMSFVFSNSTYNRAEYDNATLTVKLSQVYLEAPAVVVRGNETGVVKAKVLYTNTGEVVNTPISVAIKVNGKTVDSSRYSNGNIEFELPASYKDGSTITIAVGATYRTAALRKEIQYIKMK